MVVARMDNSLQGTTSWHITSNSSTRRRGRRHPTDEAQQFLSELNSFPLPFVAIQRDVAVATHDAPAAGNDLPQPLTAEFDVGKQCIPRQSGGGRGLQCLQTVSENQVIANGDALRVVIVVS